MHAYVSIRSFLEKCIDALKLEKGHNKQYHFTSGKQLHPVGHRTNAEFCKQYIQSRLVTTDLHTTDFQI